MTPKRWAFLFFAVFVLLGFAISAQYLISTQSQCIDLKPAKRAEVTLRALDDNLESIEAVALQTAEDQEEWHQKTAFVPPESDLGGWVTIIKVDPNLNTGLLAKKKNPILLPAQAETKIFLMVRNAWKKPHTLRVIFLLDFQQVPIHGPHGVTDYYDFPVMASQEDQALALTLTALPPGFHQLSILWIADPENTSSDSVYRLLQQKSFQEERFDLWVGINAPPTATLVFEDAKIGQDASNRFGGIEFVASPTDKTNEPLTSLVLKPSDEHCLNLRLFNAKPGTDALYTDSVPLFIAVFWNDKLEQIVNYDLSASSPENLTLRLRVQAPSEAGSYQLSAAVFTFSGYSQFDGTGTRVGYPIGTFTRRILVAVRP